MEIGEDHLRNLSMKAWSLVDKISDEIENESISVCTHCSEHRLLCGIAENYKWLEEKQRLMAIKDSLKDVNNMLMILQRLQSNQRQLCQETIIRLEKSRLHLMENIIQFQEHEDGQLNVINELNEYFGNTEMEKQFEQVGVEDDNSGVFKFTNCIRGFLNPLNWHGTAKTAIKLGFIYVSVSSTYKLCQSGPKYKCASSPESLIGRNLDFSALDSDSPLYVSYAMG